MNFFDNKWSLLIEVRIILFATKKYAKNLYKNIVLIDI